MHGGGWWMGGMWIFWIVIIAACIYFVTRFAQGFGPREGSPNDTAEKLLKERYARGEISREEYEEKLADLRR